MLLKTYLVGGAVRDQLLGLDVVEKDYVVVGSSPEEMIALNFKPIGKDFPVFLHPETKAEYALARTERKIKAGYHGFEFYTAKNVTLEDDLARRDLTINAMALDEKGNLIDPFYGQQDLENRILRHVSKAFAEDPVRVLRLARFAARFHHLGFKIADETIALINEMRVHGELNSLIAERVWQETTRALKEPSPSIYFRVLRECQALAILFPELDALFDISTRLPNQSIINSAELAFRTLDQSSKLTHHIEIRWATLTQGLGKALLESTCHPVPFLSQYTSPLPLNALRKRYKISHNCFDIANIVAQEFLLWFNASTAEKVLELFDRCDALRRLERFQQVICAWETCCTAAGVKTPSSINLVHLLNQLQSYLKTLTYPTTFTGKAIKAFYHQAKLEFIHNYTKHSVNTP